MTTTIHFSKNALEELEQLVAGNKPNISGSRGDLFVSKVIPLAVIRLKMPVDRYLAEFESPSTELTIPKRHLVPVTNPHFDVIVNAPLEIVKGEVVLAGKAVKVV